MISSRDRIHAIYVLRAARAVKLFARRGHMSAGIVQQLAKTPMFRELSLDEVGRIVDVGRVEYWQDGKLVLEEGSYGPRMMVLLEGTVEILRLDPSGVQRLIAELGPGEILGEMSLLLDMPRTATVRAKTALRVFAMDRAAFQGLIDGGDPAAFKFSLQLSRVMATRVTRLNEKVVELLMATEGSAVLREQFAKARQEVFNLWDYED